MQGIFLGEETASTPGITGGATNTQRFCSVSYNNISIVKHFQISPNYTFP